MVDVVPFKGGDFLGNLEVQGKLDSYSKQLRLQRLKEVREQEKAIALQRCASYRQCIDERKSVKVCRIKEQKRNDKLTDLTNLHNKWQGAVKESGGAHRLAKDNTSILMKKAAADSSLLQKRKTEEIQREKHALRLRQEQILETQRESIRLQELQHVKRDMRLSEREDAHAMGEAYAARQELLDCQSAALSRMHSNPKVYTQTRVQQGAVSIEQRFAVEVHARIYRHGARPKDATVIRNGAFVEESAILKKNWQLVMREMQNRIKTRVRARTAQQTVERQKGVQFLDSELQQLEAADKAPGRQFRLCNSTAVQPDAEEPRLQNTFEKMFLSKPVRLDNQHAIYRTGSHLVQAALDSRALEDNYRAEMDYSVPVAAAAKFGGSDSQHPTWHSSSLAGFKLGPKEAFEEDAASRSSSSLNSSVVSEELHVIHQDRLYGSLDGSTASDIPMISRPPPSWTTAAAPAAAEALDLKVGVPVAQPSAAHPVRAASVASTAAAGNTAKEAVAVRIPQVSAQGDATASRAAPRPMSSVSASTSNSSLDEEVSVRSISGDGSSFFEVGEHDPPGPPLTIQIAGMLDGPRVGTSTPPRHVSSRGSAAAGGLRPIDPFTPPEASLESKRKQQHQALRLDSNQRLIGNRDVAGTPQSDVSSTNTEQARHDRPPVQVQRSPPKSATQVFDDSSSALSSASRGSSHSSSSASSVPAFSLGKKSATQAEAASFASPQLRQASSRYPTLDLDEVPDAEESRGDLNISALTEQMLLGTSMEGYEYKSSSSSSSVRSAASQSTLSSASSSGPSSAPSGSRYTSSSRTSSAPSEQPPAARSQGTSRSGSSTGSSTSSSSMLSYLQSSPLPTPGKPAASSAPPSAPAPAPVPSQVASRPAGVTITVGGATTSLAARMADVSPSQSMQSDTVSMLSANSDDIRFGNAFSGADPLDSFQALTRQELQDVLDDISDDETSAAEAPSHAEHTRTNTYSNAAGTEATAGDSSQDDEDDVQAYLKQAAARADQDYQSMFDDEPEEDVDFYASRASTGAGGAHRGGVQHFERIDEASHEEDSEADQEQGEDLQSLASESTNELFDKWQQLYQGSLKLGDNARSVRSERVNAYNASTSTAIVDEADTSASFTGTPARSSYRESPPGTEFSALVASGSRVGASAGAPVPASPLDVLRFPRTVAVAGGSSLLNDSTMRTSLSSQSSEKSSGTLSDDSLSPARQAAPAAQRYALYETGPAMTQTGNVRASYDDVRATHLLGELDRLSQSWQDQQAYYGQSPARATAAATAPTRHQPAGPAPYASPSSLMRSAQPAAAQARTQSSTVVSASLSSLSAPVSPPDEPVIEDSRYGSSAQGQREAYTGRLVVHSEHRPYTAPLAHVAPTLSRAELNDSMNSSVVSSGGAYGDSALYSSQEEGDDPSLDEILNAHSTSGATLGRIQNEIAEMRKRLLATVGAPATSSSTSPAAAPVLAAAPSTAHPIRTSDAASTSRGTLYVHQESRASTSSASVAAPVRPSAGDDVPAAPTGALSSGEDTYSSSRYYSAGEARNTSGSTMHTAASGPDSAYAPPSRASPLGYDLISGGGSTYRNAVSATTTTSVTTRTLVSTQTASINRVQAETTYRSVGRAAEDMESALYDDSMRPEAYSFSRRSPGAKPALPATSTAGAAAAISHRAALDESLASPSTASVSRLSEYAMLSSHSLTTSMMRSPGDLTISPQQLPQQSRPAGYRPDRVTESEAAYGSPASSRSSASESDVRHFPSRP